jgi:two-component system response regulator (stage 0 sporulation protein F)
MDDVMTGDEVASYLHLSKITVYSLARQGSIPATKVGNNIRFHHSDIDKMLRRTETSKQFMVIDDSEAICHLVREALTRNGHFVIMATSGAQAIEFIKEIQFDKIFLDMIMPGIDGVETLRQIRLISPGVPVIVMTGFPNMKLTAQAEALGVSKILGKPFNLLDVAAAIE